MTVGVFEGDGRGVRGWRGALKDYVGAFKNFCGWTGRWLFQDSRGCAWDLLA